MTRSWLALTMTLLAACAPLEPGTPVGPEEIKADLVGKTWDVELPNGRPAREELKKDGTVVITGGLSDVGKWRYWDKGYCTAWLRMRHGEERCFTVDRTAGGQYRIYKPTVDLSMTIKGFM